MNSEAPQALEERVAAADAVVVGTVTSVNLPDQVAQALAESPDTVPHPLSEHDPQWREATIQVGSVEKGDVPQQTTVLFPASIDVAWYWAPKFHAGQSGVFVLHRQEVPELNRTALVAMHPEDYQPPQQINAVRALMKK